MQPMWGFEPSEEQLAEVEHARMVAEAFKVQFQRYLTEVDDDDLEMLTSIFSHILNSTDPRHTANFYFGVTFGARGVRNAVFGEKDDTPERLLEL